MKSANCCATEVRTLPLSTPKWTWLPCAPWRYRGLEVADESADQSFPRLLGVAPWPWIQTGPARGWATAVHVVPGAKTQFSHHGRTGVRVGYPARPPKTGRMGGTAQHCARLRPSLERHGSVDRS